MKKELQKKESNKLVKFITSIETRKLNKFGKVLVIGTYTFLIVFSTALYFNNENNEELRKEIQALKSSQEKFNKDLINQIKSSTQIPTYSRSTQNLENRIINEIHKKLDSTDKFTSMTIEDQKQQIYDLKQKLSNALLLSESNRSIASTNETLTYTDENYDILYYEHQQELKALKNKHNKIEDAYLSLYDMNKNSHQESFENLKKKHKLDYYAKRKKLSNLRSKFKKEKFLIIADYKN